MACQVVRLLPLKQELPKSRKKFDKENNARILKNIGKACTVVCEFHCGADHDAVTEYGAGGMSLKADMVELIQNHDETVTKVFDGKKFFWQCDRPTADLTEETRYGMMDMFEYHIEHMPEAAPGIPAYHIYRRRKDGAA